MIVKKLNTPIRIRKLKTLLDRLPLNHPKYNDVKNSYARHMAGYKGEKSLDYYLSFLPYKNCYILHDLRLTDNKYYFQMDILILSQSFCLILEVKNLSGILSFDPKFQQVIRLNSSVEEVFQDPVQQVKHQQFQFREWLNSHKYPPIPIESLVMMTNPHGIIKSLSGHSEVANKVIRNTKLLDKVQSFNNIHKERYLRHNELIDLSNLLIKSNTPYNPDIMKEFDISQGDLLTGVCCPKCSSIPMQRSWGKWVYLTCSYHSQDAYLYAIRDYALHIDSEITNQQLRHFLQLESSSIAQKLLKAMDLPSRGLTRGKVYQIPFHE